METKNVYSLPVEEKFIERIVKNSPAHIKFYSKFHKAWEDYTNAIDFICKEGTPIKAAFHGKVVRVKDGITKNWNKFTFPSKDLLSEEEWDGNFVVIKHENEEFSIYSHLRCHGIKVKEGDKVKTGDLIGYSGNTGWSIKPHLHFMVFKFLKPKPHRDFESLEIKWDKNSRLVIERLKSG